EPAQVGQEQRKAQEGQRQGQLFDDLEPVDRHQVAPGDGAHAGVLEDSQAHGKCPLSSPIRRRTSPKGNRPPWGLLTDLFRRNAAISPPKSNLTGGGDGGAAARVEVALRARRLVPVSGAG